MIDDRKQSRDSFPTKQIQALRVACLKIGEVAMVTTTRTGVPASFAGSEMLKTGIVTNETEPCQKSYELNATELISHIKEDGCLECLAVLRDLQREYEITETLWSRRN